MSSPLSPPSSPTAESQSMPTSSPVTLYSPCSTPEKHELDGPLTDILFNTVKTVVARLLQEAVFDFTGETCFACKADHSRELQHDGLIEIPEFYLQNHYDDVMKILWTDRFIPTIQRSLSKSGIRVSDGRIHGISEAILRRFKMTRHLTKKLYKIYEALVGGDKDKIKALQDAVAFWAGE